MPYVGDSKIRFGARVAIVTGAGRGLGREHALLLAARGARVVVNDSSEKWAFQTTADIVAAGGQAVAVVGDVSDSDQCIDIVQRTVSEFGALHIVLNNAGRGGPTGLFEDTTDEQVDMIIGTHLVGSFNMCRAAWPLMKEQHFGRVLLTSSGAGLGGLASSAYSMAKAGLFGLTRSLALEGADHNIKVNALLPIGYTRSAALNPQEDTRRWMEQHFPPAVVSPVACWLVHDDVPCTGELVNTGAGRVSLFATIGVPGYSKGLDLSVEDVRDHWDQVVSLENYKVMKQSRDDLSFYSGDAEFPN